MSNYCNNMLKHVYKYTKKNCKTPIILKTLTSLERGPLIVTQA